MNIGRQVSRGVFWVGVSTLTAQAFSWGTYIILMRILPRTAFGLVGAAMVAIGALQMFREFGFSAALIYRKDRIREAADTMFVVLIILAMALYAIAFIGALPLAGILFPADSQIADRMELAEILRLLGLIMVLGSLGQVPMAMLAREMDFRKRLLPDIVPEIVKDVLTITLALKGYGVWSLVYGHVVDMALTAALAWVVSPLRPRLRFDAGIARQMFDYGKHIQASQLLVFLITNLDNVFVSRLRGADDLGVYKSAFDNANKPATLITRLVGQVMFPALSRVRGNLADLRRVFLRAVKYTALVTVPLSVAMFVFTPPFMDILFGLKWKNAITPMQILVIYGLMRSIAGNMGEVFKAGGKPQWLLGIAAWRLTTMLVFLYPVTVRYGIVGVSALSAIVAVVDFGVSVFLVNRIAHTRAADFARILAPTFAMSLVAVVVARLVFALCYDVYPPLALLIAGLTMVVVYAALVLRLDSEVRQRMIGLLSEKAFGVRLLTRLGVTPRRMVEDT
jgi:O-antigen/teichoic acid export membrane protein